MRTNLHKGPIKDVCVLCAIRDELKNQLDSMSEMGEMESLRLQMAMDRLSDHRFIANYFRSGVNRTVPYRKMENKTTIVPLSKGVQILTP